MLELLVMPALLMTFSYWLGWSNQRRTERLFTEQRVKQLRAGEQPDAVRPRAALRGTALGALARGDRSRRAVVARYTLPTHDLRVLTFDLHARATALRWTWLDVDAPFRLLLPTTVIALRVDRDWPHVIVKLRGHADVVARRALASQDGTVGKLRDLGLGPVARAVGYLHELRPIAVAPPVTLARAALPLALPVGWRAWGPPATDDRVHRLALALVGDGRFPADRELVIEVVGDRLVAYSPAGATLSHEPLVGLHAAVLAACERALAATPTVSPRGIEPT